MSGASDAERARGQTMIDFVVAVGLFLLAVAFVVYFVPQTTAPYDDQERPLVAERATATLTDTVLAGSGVSTLDADCTVAWFEQSSTPDCPFDASAPLSEQVGIDDTDAVNVTLRRPTDSGQPVLCANGGDIGACGTSPLTAGPPVPDDASVTSVSRTVFVDGIDAVLRVRVW